MIVEYWGGPHDGHWFGASRAMLRVNSFVTITHRAVTGGAGGKNQKLFHVYKARRPLAAADRSITLYYTGAVESSTMAMPW